MKDDAASMEFLSAGAGAADRNWPDLPNLDVRVGIDRAAETGLEDVQHASSVRCPQGRDCPGGGLVTRVFACGEGCGFSGCAACMDIHESEPHLKQSPLPAQAQGTKIDWTKIGSATVLALALQGAVLTSGCGNTWEQTTYATLAAGKALIDCAVAGYNHFDADIRHACAADPNDPAFDPSRFYIAQTRDAQQAIDKARQVQMACVEAFEGYAVARVGKDPTVSLPAKQAAVAGYLAQLPGLLDAVRALIGGTSPAAKATPNVGTVGLSGAILPRTHNLARVIGSVSATRAPLRSPDHGDQRITGSSPEVSLGQ